MALLQDKAFYRSVFNSFMIVLEAMIPIQSLGLILALLMNYGIVKIERLYPEYDVSALYYSSDRDWTEFLQPLFDQNFPVR